MMPTINSTNAPITHTLGSLLGLLEADAAQDHEAFRTGRPRGPQFGLPKVDAALSGFLAPGLHLLQSAPGAGKTALSLQVAATCGFPALYVSAEMPPIELFRRTISRVTRTFLGRLKTGELPPDEVRRLALQTAQAAPWLAIMDATCAYAHPAEHIKPAAESLRRQWEAEHVLIVIDAIQPWARGAQGCSDLRDADEYTLVNAGIGELLKIGHELRCPVLAISHRNRAGNRATTSRDALHAGKGSGDLEYAAETVIDLTPEPSDTRTAEHITRVGLGIHKNRHGATTSNIKLEFEGRLQTFREAC